MRGGRWAQCSPASASKPRARAGTLRIARTSSATPPSLWKPSSVSQKGRPRRWVSMSCLTSLRASMAQPLMIRCLRRQAQTPGIQSRTPRPTSSKTSRAIRSSSRGMSGRSALGGKVIVQTYNPDHYAINAASQHDWASLAGHGRASLESAVSGFRASEQARAELAGTQAEARRVGANPADGGLGVGHARGGPTAAARSPT